MPRANASVERFDVFVAKKGGKCNGRFAYDGKPTRVWINKEDKLSPTVLNESLFPTSAFAAHEGCNIMSMDIPNACIQVDMPKDVSHERVIMKVRGRLVD